MWNYSSDEDDAEVEVPEPRTNRTQDIYHIMSRPGKDGKRGYVIDLDEDEDDAKDVARKRSIDCSNELEADLDLLRNAAAKRKTFTEGILSATPPIAVTQTVDAEEEAFLEHKRKTAALFEIEDSDSEDSDEEDPDQDDEVASGAGCSTRPPLFAPTPPALDKAEEEDWDLDKALAGMASTEKGVGDPGKAPGEGIVLKVQCKLGDVLIRIGQHEKFATEFVGKMMTYARAHSWLKAGQNMKLDLDGDDVDFEQTPTDYELEDEDVLDAIFF